MARIARALINAALANHDIQDDFVDPRPPRLWTIDGVRRNSPCRLELEHAMVIADIGESLAAARHKNWGDFIGVLPLQPDPLAWEARREASGPCRTDTGPARRSVAVAERVLIPLLAAYSGAALALRSREKGLSFLFVSFGFPDAAQRRRRDSGSRSLVFFIANVWPLDGLSTW
jgi:hypothetical protein